MMFKLNQSSTENCRNKKSFRALATTAFIGLFSAATSNSYADQYEGAPEEFYKGVGLGFVSAVPAPFGAAGVQVINNIWGTSDASEKIDAMNSKLDRIQGTLGNIQHTLNNLRGQIRQDLERELDNLQRSQISSIADYVADSFDPISGDYGTRRNEYRDDHSKYNTDYLNETYLNQYNLMLTEALNYFTSNSDLSPMGKMSTAADYAMMASLHLALIQEQIQNYTAANYWCDEGYICENRQALLQGYIDIYVGKVHEYSKYLTEVAETVHDERMSKIPTEVSSGPNGPIWSGNGQTWARYDGTWSFYAIDEATGETFFHEIVNDPTTDGYGGRLDDCDRCIDFSWPTEHPATDAQMLEFNNQLDDYRAQVKSDIDQILQDEIYGVVRGFKESVKGFSYLDGLVAQGCVVLFKDANYQGEYKKLCGDTSYARLDYLQFGSWRINLWGSSWMNNIESLKLGRNAKIRLYSKTQYKNNYLREEQKVNKPNLTFDIPAYPGFPGASISFDNDIESLKFESLVD